MVTLPNQPQIQVKIDDATAAGKYANMMQVAHNREEFVLDFINAFPPGAIVTSRVVTNPSHIKRIIKALAENLKRYEENYGEIKETQESEAGNFGFIVK